MPIFAKGKYAFGFCDRTGFRYPLKDLVTEFRNDVPTGFKVGRDMVDEQHPQDDLGRTPIDDPQALRNPRPDRSVDSLFGFNPVGNSAQYLRAEIGQFFVVIS